MNVTGSRLRRISAATGAGFMALALMATPATSLASHGGGITHAGVCSGNSTSKIKVKLDDSGMIETEFEVDQNRNNRTWHVVLKDNGTVFFSANRTTHAPSGSFSVSKLVANRAGTDTIRGRAVNLSSGEVCSAVVSI